MKNKKQVYRLEVSKGDNIELFMNESRTIMLETTRNGLDLNGNPLYKVEITTTLSMPKLNSVYRNYFSKGYYLIQSYNLKYSVINIFEELEKDENFKILYDFDFDFYNDLIDTKGFKLETAFY